MSVTYGAEALVLPLPEDQLAELASAKSGGVWYEKTMRVGAVFIGAWFATDTLSVNVAYHVDKSAAYESRGFFLVPMAHTFTCPPSVALKPLAGVMIGSAPFTLFEVVHHVVQSAESN
jgi:hypothetical protein